MYAIQLSILKAIYQRDSDSAVARGKNVNLYVPRRRSGAKSLAWEVSRADVGLRYGQKAVERGGGEHLCGLLELE